MLYLQQLRMEYTGWLGLFVASLLLLGLVIAALKGIHWLWNSLLAPGRDKFQGRDSTKRRIAFLEFQAQWVREHYSKAIFILDDSRRCIEVNDELCELLDADSSDLMGRKWHQFVKESTLTRTLEKWDEAYKHQGPYVNLSILIVNGEEQFFMTKATPFVWAGKVMRYVATIEPRQDRRRIERDVRVERRQLKA
jgi:PAS domain S-box-containing protein